MQGYAMCEIKVKSGRKMDFLELFWTFCGTFWDYFVGMEVR